MDRRTFLLRTGVTVLTPVIAYADDRPRLTAKLEAGVLRVLDEGRPVLSYRHHPVEGPAGTGPLFARSAYLHPVWAPCGAVVTDDFPPDHKHQRGVFFAWTKTRVVTPEGELHPDFWNLGDGTGRVRSVRLEGKTVSGGPARFEAVHEWEARQGEEWRKVMTETWEVTVHPPAFSDPTAPEAAYVIDLTSRQTPLFDLELPEYRYGGMAVRGAREWTDPASGLKALTSEGKDRRNGDATRARWVDQSGRVEERLAGVALLEHPKNAGAPNPLRLPPEPQYVYAVFSPPRAGALLLAARKTYDFRYRIVAHNGGADAETIEKAWREFSSGG